MNTHLKQIFTPTLVSFALLLGLASSASAVEIMDGCDAGIPDPADIDTLTATFDDANDKITVVLDLCGNTDNKTKYRIHLDHTAPFAGDSPIDCPDNPDPDLCCTTSDDTMMTRVHRNSSKDTGPGMITVIGDKITYMVTLAELGLDPQQGDTKVLIWADTHFQGISDRAPNTEWGDGCAKPESLTEVLELSLLVVDTEKIVFVTRQDFTGNLGGLSGADDKCNTAATAGGLPGTYTAWLSDSGNDAKDRVTQSALPYLRTDGVRVADNFADILNCGNPFCLQAPIRIDEFVNLIGGSARAWTGTRQTGIKSGGFCSDWVSAAPGVGVAGALPAVILTWTFRSGEGCQFSGKHLYCFQD